jgi:tetratricopeptide (TPR) repeat protein
VTLLEFLACEALYVIGDWEKLLSIIEEPILKARCFDDKLNAYHTLVRYLRSAGDMKGVIEKCKSVLSQLGDDLPDQVDESLIQEESRRVEQLLKDKSEEELISLPKMTNERKIASMQFLNHAISSAYSSDPLLAPILVARIVALSVEYGVCEISTFGFACYGSWLVSALKSDFEGGYRMGHVAIELKKRLGAVEWIPRIYATVYGFINIWKTPFQASLPKHLEAYDAGNLSGDVEYTLSNLYMHASASLYGCGDNLREVDTSTRVFILRCKQSGQNFLGKYISVIHEVALKLMGAPEKSYSLFFDTTEERMFIEAREQNTISLCRFILFKRKYVAFFLGQMNAAADFFEMGLNFPIGGNGRLVSIIVGVFIDGLIAFYYARKHRSDENRWAEIGNGVINLMEVWAKASDWNFSNKLFLLQAEYFFLQGDERAALQKYNASIKSAQDHRFIHEEGLAHERLASFHHHYHRRGEAITCFNAAKRCYENWGAQAVVQRVERTIAKL